MKAAVSADMRYSPQGVTATKRFEARVLGGLALSVAGGDVCQNGSEAEHDAARDVGRSGKDRWNRSSR